MLGSFAPPLSRSGMIPPGRDGGGSAGTDRLASGRGRFAEFYRRIESEIERGLPNEKLDRLDQARVIDDYYHCRFRSHVQTWSFDRDAIRTVPIVRHTVDILTRSLYKDGPARSVKDQDALSDWYSLVCRHMALDALWQEADRLAALHQVAAFEVQGNTGDDSIDRPLGLVLWGGNELVVWLDPDNPRQPIAVATMDTIDEQRRVRLWTPEQRVTFITAKRGPLQTSGGTAYSLYAREENPYGIIPFSFVHFRFPATYFWSGSPGADLMRLNYHVNFRLSQTADDILHSRPVGVLQGAAPDWNFPRDRQSGTFTTIPPAIATAAGAGVEKPELKYVTCDLGFLDQDRQDLQSFIDLVMILNDVPPGSIRLRSDASTASGVSIVMSDELPLLRWSESRQRPFTYYEQNLFRVICRVAAAHAANNDQPDLLSMPVAELDAAARQAELSVKWKSQLGPILAMQRTQWDTFRLSNYLLSRTQWIMETYNLDRDEAEQHVADTAADVSRENELFAPPTPEAPAQAGEPEPGAEPEPVPPESEPAPSESEPSPSSSRSSE